MLRSITTFLLLVSGCAMNKTSESNFLQSDLRVMSFNIRFATAPDGENHWDLRQDAAVKAIQAFDPDILGTQETLLVQRDFIPVRLPQFAAVGVGRDDGKEKGEMTAAFYRRDRFELLDSGHFWLSETPQTPGSKSWDTAITRMATWLKLRDRNDPTTRPLLVINAHFDHVGKVAREESAKLIRRQAETLGEGCSVLIIGDFNCTESDAPYAQLAGQRVGATTLIDTYRQVHSERAENEATFTAFKPEAIKGNRIDFIFASDDLNPTAAGIDRNLYDGRLPSDHFPVTATLRRTGRPAKP
ncbi:MAG TPA: endonuclease/exonuclease/phosphatase family protein [Tepidisphaeraceae bacterium]|nr:endonuclease/exonuclease/phosphatase family protein [Tepidisphaeraceae bacterium]